MYIKYDFNNISHVKTVFLVRFILLWCVIFKINISIAVNHNKFY
jgi:hypothetical protein